jgi:diguanylate cyclase (GGDEF)-like protein
MVNKKIKALLIEDSLDVARLIHEELKDIPYSNIDMEVADRLKDGIDIIKRGDVDVILLDLSLPDSHGYDTFVRVHVHASQVPIVVLSGNSDELLAIKTIQAGAQDFLVKGELDAEVLVRSIHYSIERQKTTNELRSMLLYDRLTGLHNRRGLLTLAEQQMNISRRDKKDLFILFVDLHNMRLTDKANGYSVGDVALIETANILRKTFRTSDIIGRIDSDEFAVVPIDAHKSSIRIMDTRLLKNVQTFNTKNNNGFELSVKTGVTHYDQGEPISFEELLMRADI